MPGTVPRILFAAGGTGGHVYPAIAVADAVKRIVPDAEIIFAGTRDRLEWQAVPKAGYSIHPITISGMPRSASLDAASFPIDLIRGLIESWNLVRHMEPDVAVGTGGYVSGPVLLAAKLRGVPFVLQEQNAYAGLTNRLLSRWAEEVHIAFEEAKGYVPPEKCVMSGNPTRDELQHADRSKGRMRFDLPEDATVLFVFGGSLGSQALNDAVEAHYRALLEDKNLHILWQTGPAYFERIVARFEPHPRVQLLKYVERMEHAYAASDLVLCRAGAIACSELMVTGTPSILVPSPNVTEDHQTKNAASMANAGAAVLLRESKLMDGFTSTIRDLLQDDDRRTKMADAARQMAQPDAADMIARHVLKLANYPLNKVATS